MVFPSKHGSSPAPALQDALGERDWYDPMRWGGAAPVEHCGGGPLGGGAAELSARIVEPVEVPGLLRYPLGLFKDLLVPGCQNNI